MPVDPRAENLILSTFSKMLYGSLRRLKAEPSNPQHMEHSQLLLIEITYLGYKVVLPCYRNRDCLSITKQV